MGLLSKPEKDSKFKEFREKTNLNIENETLADLIEKFGTESLFFNIAYSLFKRNINISENMFTKVMNELSRLKIHFLNEDEYISTAKAIAEYLEILELNSLTKIMCAFSDKKIISEALLYIFEMFRNSNQEIEIENRENLEIAVSYLVEARKYYVDDRALFSSFISFINKIGVNALKYASKEEILSTRDYYLSEDKRSNGIYDISQEELEFLRQIAEELGIKSEQLKTLISLSDQNIETTKATYEELKNDVIEYAKRQMRSLEDKSNEALSSFDTKYTELIAAQKRDIAAEKDILIRAVETVLGEKKAELISFINQVKYEYENDISNLRKEQRGILSSIDSYIENSQALKNAIQTSQSDKEFLEKIETIEAIAEKISKNGGINAVVSGTKEQGSNQTIRNDSNVILPQGNVIIASPNHGINKPVDYKELYYFDRSNKFTKRFKELMEIKKRLIAEGEIFHECFDDVLTIIIHNDVPYLYGPSGSGKTYMIETQLSKVLGLNVVTNGYIQYEQDILGYNNAGDGGYVPTNFYRAFLYGDVLFFDELDNSNPDAVPVLNGFLTGKKKLTYTFPNGATIRRHPNFRIITAGNTKGEGRTTEYSSRQKMDESVLQRIWAVECDYQSDIEAIILKDYNSWFEFSQSFRNAIEHIQLSNDQGINSFGTFTTRDAESVREYLEDESFTYKQLIKYLFIQTKDPDYLSLIYSKMDEDSKNYKEKDTKMLLKEFKRQMNERASKQC